jgi:hypothetical protein
MQLMPRRYFKYGKLHLVGLDSFMAEQQSRLSANLTTIEARLKERLKDIGQDRQSRLALTLEMPVTEDWQQTHHASGRRARRLDEADRYLQY